MSLQPTIHISPKFGFTMPSTHINPRWSTGLTASVTKREERAHDTDTAQGFYNTPSTQSDHEPLEQCHSSPCRNVDATAEETDVPAACRPSRTLLPGRSASGPRLKRNYVFLARPESASVTSQPRWVTPAGRRGQISIFQRRCSQRPQQASPCTRAVPGGGRGPDINSTVARCAIFSIPRNKMENRVAGFVGGKLLRLWRDSALLLSPQQNVTFVIEPKKRK